MRYGPTMLLFTVSVMVGLVMSMPSGFTSEGSRFTNLKDSNMLCSEEGRRFLYIVARPNVQVTEWLWLTYDILEATPEERVEAYKSLDPCEKEDNPDGARAAGFDREGGDPQVATFNKARDGWDISPATVMGEEEVEEE